MGTASRSRQSANGGSQPKSVRQESGTTPTKHSDSITVASVIHVIPDSSSDEDDSGRYSPPRELAEILPLRSRKRAVESKKRSAPGSHKSSSDRPPSPKRRKTRDVLSRTPTPSDPGRPSSKASASSFTPYASLHLAAESQQLKGQNLDLKKKLDQAEDERRRLESENSSMKEKLIQSEKLVDLLTRAKEACKADEEGVHGMQPLEEQKRKTAALEAELERTAPQLEAVSTSLRSFWQQHIGEVAEGDDCLDLLTKLQQLYVPLHREVSRLEEINHGLEEQYRERDSELPETLSRISWLEGREKDLADDKASLEAKVAELHSGLQRKEIRTAVLQEENTSLRDDLNQMRKKADETESELRQASGSWHARELAFAATMRKQGEDLEAAKEEVSRACARENLLEGQLTSLAARQASELGGAQQRVRELEDQALLLRQEISRFQEQETRLREQAANMGTNVMEYISDLEKHYNDSLDGLRKAVTAKLTAREEQSKKEIALFKGYLAKRGSA